MAAGPLAVQFRGGQRDRAADARSVRPQQRGQPAEHALADAAVEIVGAGDQCGVPVGAGHRVRVRADDERHLAGAPGGRAVRRRSRRRRCRAPPRPATARGVRCTAPPTGRSGRRSRSPPPAGGRRRATATGRRTPPHRRRRRIRTALADICSSPPAGCTGAHDRSRTRRGARHRRAGQRGGPRLRRRRPPDHRVEPHSRTSHRDRGRRPGDPGRRDPRRGGGRRHRRGAGRGRRGRRARTARRARRRRRRARPW